MKQSPKFSFDNSKVEVGDGILCYALRYAIGRRTYAVGEVCQEIKQNMDRIRPKLKVVMIRDIEEALAEGRTGMDMDTREWLSLLEILKSSNAKHYTG